MSLEIPAAAGSRSSAVSVSADIFGQEFNEALVHQTVVWYMAGGRSGTKAQKTRAEVSGGGKKPWKQKGSGRARAGTTRSPLWRTGGVTFAASPRSYEQKLNKKMFRAAMRSIFSELLRQGRLEVHGEILPAEAKTRLLLAALGDTAARSTLIITEAFDRNLYLAARNVPHLEVTTSDALSPVALVNSERVIITEGAAKRIEAGLE
ncbi:50S ribosomal protein L4 [Methylotetracoccus oryzae]|uniref:50S ribosomal protein L4 n=1 Tax=Methylotetracoccus oryzae TaxID=1919059 RepID=UPI00111ABD4F|nr:50S ribosomal protein L4 [Methylotetracoccus oryzae]